MGATGVADGASFRDPSGQVFERDGVIYRRVEPRFSEDWNAFVERGVYARLAANGLIVSHREVPLEIGGEPLAYRVLEPERIPIISYPYEWSFGMLRDAALLTLDAQEAALSAGMTLRDASGPNVQFLRGRPILIDSLSFGLDTPGEPWIAYRQFCQHFLAPLALMAYRDVRCGLLERVFADGMPLDLAARLLPGRTRLRPSLLSHLHLHAAAQRRYGGEAAGDFTQTHRAGAQKPAGRIGDTGRRALLESLRGVIGGFRWEPQGTAWAGYTARSTYTEAGARAKAETVTRWLGRVTPGRVLDVGASNGTYSRIAAGIADNVIAIDGDAAAVDVHYRTLRRDGIDNVLPLVVDLGSPSPAGGWHLREQRSIVERARADVVMALALVHHLRVTTGVPFRLQSRFFADLGPWLIIEFVPRADPMAQRLLANRADTFPDFAEPTFREAFTPDFEIVDAAPVDDSERTLFLMRRRS